MHTTCDIFQQRVNEAFSMYCDDEDTGKKVVFNKGHIEGMIWQSLWCRFLFYCSFENVLWDAAGEISTTREKIIFMWHIQGGIIVVSSNFFAVFEEAFSMFDVNASGKIQFKFFFPLLRSLGYNIHQAEAWDYLNELELAGRVTRNSYFVNNSNKIWFGTKLSPIIYFFKLITWRDTVHQRWETTICPCSRKITGLIALVKYAMCLLYCSRFTCGFHAFHLQKKTDNNSTSFLVACRRKLGTSCKR